MAEDTGNREFPVAFAEFARTLIGTADEVWTHVLRRAHRAEKHVMADWKRLVDTYRNKPAHRR